MRAILNLIPVSLAMTIAALGQPAAAPQTEVGPPPSLIQTALANELQAAQDTAHPMRYQLRKSSPHLTTTKNLIETRDGSVALLVAVNDKPLTPQDLGKDQSRLQTLLSDPGKQRHRNQVEAEDTSRALKVLRSLPAAFLYTDAGTITTGTLTAEKFAFSPNPKFNPPDLETQVLTALSGEIWVDPSHARVLRLAGRLQQDVDFGWGILGRLSKGGWIVIDQGEVGNGVWRVVKFQMNMTGRLLIRTRTFNTTEEESNFQPVPSGLSYKQAITMLRESQSSGPGGR